MQKSKIVQTTLLQPVVIDKIDDQTGCTNCLYQLRWSLVLHKIIMCIRYINVVYVQ